jgi:hypothetical protein
LSVNFSTDRCIKIGNLNKNKTLLPETIEKLREKALTRKNLIFSEQALLYRKKISKPIIIYNLDSTFYGKFTSVCRSG